jgi:hypothetical protein
MFDPLFDWLKSNVLGLIIIATLANYIVVLISKGRRAIGPFLSRQLLTPYAIHWVALKKHHGVAGMPLSIYISWHLARLISYSGVAFLLYIVAFVASLSNEVWLLGYRIPASILSAVTVLAALVYNFQALSAFLTLRLLYVRQVDPLVKKISPAQRAQAHYDPVAMMDDGLDEDGPQCEERDPRSVNVVDGGR